MERAQDDLTHFWRDNARIDAPYVQIDRLLSFADIVVDGPLFDLMAQRKLRDARERLDKACQNVEEVLASLPDPSEV